MVQPTQRIRTKISRYPWPSQTSGDNKKEVQVNWLVRPTAVQSFRLAAAVGNSGSFSGCSNWWNWPVELWDVLLWFEMSGKFILLWFYGQLDRKMGNIQCEATGMLIQHRKFVLVSNSDDGSVLLWLKSGLEKNLGTNRLREILKRTKNIVTLESFHVSLAYLGY